MRYDEYQRQKRQLRARRRLLNMNFLLAILSALGAAAAAYREGVLDKPARHPVSTQFDTASVGLPAPAGASAPFVRQEAFDTLRQEVAALRRSLAAGRRPVGRAVADSVQQLDARMARLEHAVLADPSKSLETVLLRKDLEMAVASEQQSTARLESEVSRFYEEMHWAFGLILGLFGLAIAHYLKSAKSETTPERPAAE